MLRSSSSPDSSSLRTLTFLLAAMLLISGAAFATKETVILPFNITNGMTPLSGFVADKAGNLYGVTSIGGNGNCSDFGGGGGCGTVYELSPPASVTGAWTETVLYNFQGGTDGDEVVGTLVFDKSGNLYGTTALGGAGVCTFGCGTVFELIHPATKGGTWTKSTLYTFQGGTADSAYPAAALVFDTHGHLFGTSQYGGGLDCGGNGCGTVFELSPPKQKGGAWTEAVLHTFVGPTSTDAYAPSTSLIFDSAGNLYGTAGFGGLYNNGAAFEMNPPAAQGGTWSESVIYSFIGPPDGASPAAGLVLAPSGVFYGTASGWGPALAGTVFELDPPAQQGGAWTETVLHSFTLLTDGGVPGAGVILDAAGNLYGTTAVGGNYSCNAGFNDGCGLAYKLAPPATKGGVWKETVLHAFTGGSDGIQPEAALIFGKFGLLYGTTEAGGASGAGTVFSVVK
jgi:hypothetical protein